MNGAPPGGSSPLLSHARAVLLEVRDFAVRQGHDGVRDELAREASGTGPPMLRVVLCGETGRGKSTLANALLDRPGLLPAQRDVPTAVHVVVRQLGADEAVGARIHAADGSFEAPLDDVGRFAVAPGAVDHRVRLIEVAIDHPMLACGITLLDTPGVGGLERARGRVARAALDGADAALVVVDASEKINASEVALVRSAVERVDVALVALNRIDENPGWKVIAAEDARVLSNGAVGAGAPDIAPVSARMKVRADRRALRGDDPELIADLAAESGVPALRARLDAWSATRADAVVAARACRIGLAAVARMRAATEELLTAGSGTADAHRARAAAARQTRDRLAEDQRRITRRVQHARQVLSYEIEASINRRFGDVTVEFARRVSAGRRQDLQADLEAALAAALDTVIADLQRRFDALAADVADALADHGAELDVATLPLEPDVRPSVEVAELPPRQKTVGVLGIIARGGTAAGSALVNPVFGLSLLAGMLLDTGHRLSQARSQQLSQQIGETIAGARVDATFLVRQSALAAQDALADAADGAIRRRMSDLDEAVAVHETQARASVQRRERTASGARAALEQLGALERELGAVKEAAWQALGAVPTPSGVAV